MKKLFIGIAIALSIVTSSGCEQTITRNFGGEIVYQIPANTQLVNIAWKDDNMWILYVDPATNVCTFQESSNLGVLQGSVTIPNCNAAK